MYLLNQIVIKNVSELTPKKGILYKTAKKLIKKVTLMSKKTCSLKTQLKIAKKIVISDSCNNLADKLNKTTLDFIKTQVNIQHRNPKGIRYTLDDKILLLTIYKTCLKGIGFFHQYFLFHQDHPL